MSRIHLVDVTNRDGVQTSRIGLAKLEKTILNLLLSEMGIAQSEFGFPFTRHEAHYLNANLELAAMGVLRPMMLSGWCTARTKEVAASFDLVPGLERMNVSVSTSPQMIEGKLSGGKALGDVIAMARGAVKAAYARGAKAVAVNAEDASRTPVRDLVEFALAGKEAGATRLRYCDTLGYEDPRTCYDRIKEIAGAIGMDVEMHCHNDLGMAVANSVAGAQAAVDAGVDCWINTTVNGVGERAGNADMLAVILALRHSAGTTYNAAGTGSKAAGTGSKAAGTVYKAAGTDYKAAGTSDGRYAIAEDIDLSKAWRVAKYAAYAFGLPIPINQPGVGANAFAHESGIHADGALKDRRNYELYPFEELGLGEPEIIETGRKITLGEYSGIKGFRNVYEKLEVEFRDDAEAEEVLELARYANVHTRKPLTDLELKFIARHPGIARKIMTVTP